MLEIQIKLAVTRTSVVKFNVDGMALSQLLCIYGKCTESGDKSYTEMLATSCGICLLIIKCGVKKTKLAYDLRLMPN